MSGSVLIIESKEFKKPTNSTVLLLTELLGCKLISADTNPLLFVLIFYNNV